MNVLLTGAFGNVGLRVLEALVERGHHVRAFDLRTPAAEKAARAYAGRAEIVWGDLRNAGEVAAAVAGQDVVVHLAFVIPRLSATGVNSEDQPEWARAINVGGTRHLLDAMKAQPAPPRMLFTSSLHIYGRTAHLPPPRRVTDVPQPIEHYAKHKVECEAMIRASGLEWAIFRLGAALPVRLIMDPGIFDVALDNRIEFVHSRDVALAIANALETDEVWGQVWHIGGGPRCQLYQRELVERVLGTVGIGMLPERVFPSTPYPVDWLDTTDSQRVLNYQQHTLDDYLADLRARLGPLRGLVRVFRPFVRTWLLRKSPLAWDGAKPGGQRVAVITGASSGIGAATALELARQGFAVCLVARSAERLQQVAGEIAAAGGQAHVIQADLAEEAERDRVFAEVMACYQRVDLLVNSAGALWYGFTDSMPPSLVRQMLEVNARAVADLTMRFLPGMKQRRSGHIINLGSIVASIPSQGTALYSATKAFVDAFTTALHRELRGTGVCASVVRTGAVRTPLFDRAEAAGGLRTPFQSLAVAPEAVARRIAKLVRHPRRVAYFPGVLVLVPWVERAFAWLIDRLGPLLLRRQAAH